MHPYIYHHFIKIIIIYQFPMFNPNHFAGNRPQEPTQTRPAGRIILEKMAEYIVNYLVTPRQDGMSL